jgi:23S rRNA pseudouridine2457 synthase
VRLILLNKPFHILSRFTSDDGRPTLATCLSAPGFHPAGRLDYASEGLMLLTDHGPLQARLTHPSWKVYKTYYVQVEKIPTEASLEKLRKGMMLSDGMTKPAKVELLMTQPDWVWPRNPPIRMRRLIPTAWIKMSIIEGRNRQIRRMTAAIGHPTLRLIRWSVGTLTLENLKTGEWREVNPAEFVKLLGFIRNRAR